MARLDYTRRLDDEAPHVWRLELTALEYRELSPGRRDRIATALRHLAEAVGASNEAPKPEVPTPRSE